MRERYPGRDMQATYEGLRRLGAPYGLTFVDRPILANSRIALEAGEFARDNGLFAPFHGEIFKRYFALGENISQPVVILQVAKDIGLDIRELATALEEFRYAGRLQAAQQLAASLAIYNVPTFIVNGRHKIVGTPPLDEWRKLLSAVADE